MNTSSEPIRITRGRGGEVDVEGTIDAFAAQILKRAGFLTFPNLRGSWIRLPFDMGITWENEHASWAADMLTTARYSVHLDPDLRSTPPTTPPPAPRRTKAAMTAHPAPPPALRRPRR